ncbi:hypothetical protein GOV11_05215 [Candidatus Woesearchaeota archaeon]|nr:hypothetical protein [Candidatus Woesearchaeota archaeon]
MSKHSRKVLKSIREDLSSATCTGVLPDGNYSVSLASNYRRGYRLHGIPFRLACALDRRHVKITVEGLPDEFLSLDTQRAFRTSVLDVIGVGKYEEPFAIGLVTKGHYADGSRVFDDLLEAAIHIELDELRDSEGTLPTNRTILTGVPHNYFIFD